MHQILDGMELAFVITGRRYVIWPLESGRPEVSASPLWGPRGVHRPMKTIKNTKSLYFW